MSPIFRDAPKSLLSKVSLTFTWGCVIYIVNDNIIIVVLTMCNLTISSILQKPNSYVTECTHTLACGDEGVNQCT